MELNAVQRWRAGRDSYRPRGEVIEPRRYEVAPIASDRVARGFVREHHYAATMPPARFRYGLYRGEQLVGVAVFTVAQRSATYRGLPGPGVDLGRFVLLDDVPANGETWFLARCFEILRGEGLGCVVSFSDPMQRRTAAGDIVFGGHLGTIYQAHNATYLGTSKAETKWLLPDGKVIPNRSLSKIRKRDQGWAGAAATLERFGADPLRADDDPVAWVARWRAEICRPVRHPGNHKYAWAVCRRDRRHLPVSKPYPKILTPQRGLFSEAA